MSASTFITSVTIRIISRWRFGGFVAALNKLFFEGQAVEV